MTRLSRRRPLADERGATMVEMALVTPLLLLLVFGIVSYGLLLSYKQQMTQVAAEAARLGAVAGDAAAAATAVEASFLNNGEVLDRVCDDADANDDGLACEVEVDACAGATGGECLFVTVSLDNRDHPLVPPLPFVSMLLPGTVSSTSAARIGGS